MAQETVEKKKPLSSMDHTELFSLSEEVQVEIEKRSKQFVEILKKNLGHFTTKQLEDISEAIDTELEERPEEEETEDKSEDKD